MRLRVCPTNFDNTKLNIQEICHALFFEIGNANYAELRIQLVIVRTLVNACF